MWNSNLQGALGSISQETCSIDDEPEEPRNRESEQKLRLSKKVSIQLWSYGLCNKQFLPRSKHIPKEGGMWCSIKQGR